MRAPPRSPVRCAVEGGVDRELNARVDADRDPGVPRVEEANPRIDEPGRRVRRLGDAEGPLDLDEGFERERPREADPDDRAEAEVLRLLHRGVRGPLQIDQNVAAVPTKSPPAFGETMGVIVRQKLVRGVVSSGGRSRRFLSATSGA